MKWISKHQPNNHAYEIIFDENVGYYFYVYENGIDTHDYLQDTLEIAMEQAEEDFGVPLDSWVKVA